MNDFDYYPNFLTKEEADELFDYISTSIVWHSELNTTDGQKVKIPRKMAYYGETIGLWQGKTKNYEYANLSFPAKSWDDIAYLYELSRKLYNKIGAPFNSVLLNYYKNGKDQINWHSDKEESLGDRPIIACVNLGATRKFWYREKTKDSTKQYFNLCHGDLLVMNENCQKNYLHAILAEKDIKEPRISLTYRFNF